MSAKSDAVIALAESKLGDPYVYGARGEQCTPGIRRKYAGYNPQYKDKIYGACPVLSGSQSTCNGCKWQGHCCYDCRGFTYYCLREAAGITIDGGGATTQYGNAANWAMRGEITSMPDLVCCVFKKKGDKMSHTGLHVGGGRIIHCSTIVKTGSTADKTWTHFAVPIGLYTEKEIREAGGINVKPTLRRGDKGEYVRTLQLDLYWLGWVGLQIDGIFGGKTEAAVREFQGKSGLKVDGIVGPLTWGAIDGMLKETGHTDMAEEDPSGNDVAGSCENAASTDNKFAIANAEFADANGYVPKDDHLTIANVPVQLTLMAGETIGLDGALALDLCERLQAAGSQYAEIITPAGCRITLTAAAAMNLYQQMCALWGVSC